MADFPELGPNEDHTPESLELKLREYAKAVESEWKVADEAAKASGEENAEDFALDFAKKNLANNLAQLQWLAQNSMSDAVRANCSKYLVGLAREDAKSDGDPIKELMKELQKKPALAPATANKEN